MGRSGAFSGRDDQVPEASGGPRTQGRGWSFNRPTAICGRGRLTILWMAYRWDRGFAHHRAEKNGWEWTTWPVKGQAANDEFPVSTLLNRLGFGLSARTDTGINPGRSAALWLPLW